MTAISALLSDLVYDQSPYFLRQDRGDLGRAKDFGTSLAKPRQHAPCKECRPSTAAMGTTRPVRVGVILVARVSAIFDLGELPQRSQQVSDLQRAGSVGWLFQ